MKKKHIKKLIKLYEKLNDEINDVQEVWMRDGSCDKPLKQNVIKTVIGLFELREELEDKFEKLASKLDCDVDAERSTESQDRGTLSEVTSVLNQNTDHPIIYMSDIRDPEILSRRPGQIRRHIYGGGPSKFSFKDTVERINEHKRILAEKRHMERKQIADERVSHLEKYLTLSELTLRESGGLTQHPVVASHNPDLWYSDPKHQHNLGGGYPTWTQSKHQQKSTQVNLDINKIPSLLEIMQSIRQTLKDEE